MKDDEELGSFILLIMWTCAVSLLVGFTTQRTCDDIWRDQLTKSGHAEYFLDEKNVRQWHMKEALRK